MQQTVLLSFANDIYPLQQGHVSSLPADNNLSIIITGGKQ